MGTFEYLQRKSSAGSSPVTMTSQQLRSSRPLAPAPFPTPEQVSPDQRTQPAHSPGLKYSLADIPIFPPERENRTGLPDNLKAGIENLSGMAMDDVHVHYNSSKPAKVQALAYTQGMEIHVGPGQEKHLPHEAWHVVQQSQGRVRPTLQTKGVAINDDQKLEREADRMGAKAVQDRRISTDSRQNTGPALSDPNRATSSQSSDLPIQMHIEINGKKYTTLEEIKEDKLLEEYDLLTGEQKQLFKKYLVDGNPHTIDEIKALTSEKVSFGSVTFEGSTNRLPPFQSVEVPVKISGGSQEDVVIDVAGSGSANGRATITSNKQLTDTGMVTVQGVDQTPPGKAGNLKLRAKVGNETVAESPGFTVAAWPKDFAVKYVSDIDTPNNLGLVVQDSWKSDALFGLIKELNQVEISEQVGLESQDNPPFTVSKGLTSAYLKGNEMLQDKHSYGRPFIDTSKLDHKSYTMVYPQIHLFKCDRTGVTDQVMPASGFKITHRVWWDEVSSKWKHKATKVGAETKVGSYTATAGDGNVESKEHALYLGTVVDVESESGKKTFIFVEEKEVDQQSGRYSYKTPVGIALMGHQEGESVKVTTPAKEITYKILSKRPWFK